MKNIKKSPLVVAVYEKRHSKGCCDYEGINFMSVGGDFADSIAIIAHSEDILRNKLQIWNSELKMECKYILGTIET